MGADKQEEISRGLRRPRGDSKNSGGANWVEVKPELLRRLIQIASERGGAVRFGLTSDCGAYSVGVYHGDDRWTDFIRPSEDIDGYILDLIACFEDATLAPKKDWKKRKN